MSGSVEPFPYVDLFSLENSIKKNMKNSIKAVREGTGPATQVVGSIPNWGVAVANPWAM